MSVPWHPARCPGLTLEGSDHLPWVHCQVSFEHACAHPGPMDLAYQSSPALAKACHVAAPVMQLAHPPLREAGGGEGWTCWAGSCTVTSLPSGLWASGLG